MKTRATTCRTQGCVADGRRSERASANAVDSVSRGFTLIELLIVIGIIAALLAILVPGLGGIHDKAAKAQTTAILGAIQTGLQQYYSDFNMYPPSAGSGRGSVMLALGLMGPGGDPQFGFRTVKVGAGMGGGSMGQIYGPYVPPDSKSFRATATTRYFVDSWGNEILYYRSTRSTAGSTTTPVTSIFNTGGGSNPAYYFDSSDCSSVPGASGPGSGTTKFFGQLGSTAGNNLSSASFTVLGGQSFLLVSAGPDGKYFTDDDLVAAK